MRYHTLQYNTMQCNTIQYNTIQYNTIQYNTTPAKTWCARKPFVKFSGSGKSKTKGGSHLKNPSYFSKTSEYCFPEFLLKKPLKTDVKRSTKLFGCFLLKIYRRYFRKLEFSETCRTFSIVSLRRLSEPSRSFLRRLLVVIIHAIVVIILSKTCNVINNLLTWNDRYYKREISISAWVWYSPYILHAVSVNK